MSKHRIKVTIAYPIDTVVMACQEAVAQLGWRVIKQSPYNITCKENSPQITSFTWPAQIEVSWSGTGGKTNLSLKGSIFGMGPIQSNHLKGQMGNLQNRIDLCLRKSQQAGLATPVTSSLFCELQNKPQFKSDNFILKSIWGIVVIILLPTISANWLKNQYSSQQSINPVSPVPEENISQILTQKEINNFNNETVKSLKQVINNDNLFTRNSPSAIDRITIIRQEVFNDPNLQSSAILNDNPPTNISSSRWELHKKEWIKAIKEYQQTNLGFSDGVITPNLGTHQSIREELLTKKEKRTGKKTP